MQPVSQVGEKELVSRLITRFFDDPELEVPLGDDAGVVGLTDDLSLVVTIDKIPEDPIGLSCGVMTYVDVGRYLVAANLGDLAAMGASPLALLLSICTPSSFPVDRIQEILDGVSKSAREFGVPVAGGDTKQGSGLGLVAAAIGTVRKGRALTHARATSGDVLLCTGNPGLFGAALAYVTVAKPRGFVLPSAAEDQLLDSMRQPQARVEQGMLLCNAGAVTECQDISDGLGQTFREIAQASSVGVHVDLRRIPSCSSTIIKQIAQRCGCTPETILLGPGADFELVFAVSPDQVESTIASFRERQWLVQEIGRVTDTENTVKRLDGTIDQLPEVGWDHFRSKSDLSTLAELYGR